MWGILPRRRRIPHISRHSFSPTSTNISLTEKKGKERKREREREDMWCVFKLPSFIHLTRSRGRSRRGIQLLVFIFMFILLKSTQSFHPNRVFQSCRNLSMRSATNRHHGHGSLSKKILVPVADGTEELEAITIIDVLARAGATVQVASVTGNLNVVCSRGVKLTADCLIQDCVSDTFDAIVCPGGMPGAQHLSGSHELHELLKHQSNHNKLTAAICASPAVVLAHHGIIGDRPATCYPAEKFIAKIPNYCTDPVVVDGNLITSQGPGTSLPFSLKVVEALFGEEKVASLERELVFNQH